MLMTLLGIGRLVKLLHQLNAQSPMSVTLSGIVTSVRGEYENAWSPILVTGKPLGGLGMVTAPPGPVYLVMVMPPLLVV